MGESVMPRASFSSAAVASLPFARYSSSSLCPSRRFSFSAFFHAASRRGWSLSRE
ncbi:hypothetical protein [Anaerotignum faecicola]